MPAPAGLSTPGTNLERLVLFGVIVATGCSPTRDEPATARTPQDSVRADSIARSIEIFGRIMTLDEMLDELRAVDAAAARAAGQAMLAGPRASAAIGGKIALAA